MAIEIQQPQAFDIVGKEILIAGNADAFEGHLNIIIINPDYMETDAPPVAISSTQVGAYSMTQFQAKIIIPNNGLAGKQLQLIITDNNEEPLTSVEIPVIYGPLILNNYAGYIKHKVSSGDTLYEISRKYFDEDSSYWEIIKFANPHLISNENKIEKGTILCIPQV